MWKNIVFPIRVNVRRPRHGRLASAFSIAIAICVLLVHQKISTASSIEH